MAWPLLKLIIVTVTRCLIFFTGRFARVTLLLIIQRLKKKLIIRSKNKFAALCRYSWNIIFLWLACTELFPCLSNSMLNLYCECLYCIIWTAAWKLEILMRIRSRNNVTKMNELFVSHFNRRGYFSSIQIFGNSSMKIGISLDVLNLRIRRALFPTFFRIFIIRAIIEHRCWFCTDISADISFYFRLSYILHTIQVISIQMFIRLTFLPCRTCWQSSIVYLRNTKRII